MTRIRLLIGPTICLALFPGCTIGNWNICGPQTPRAYCDKEAYKALVHPVVPRDDWAKAGVSSEIQSSDW